MGRGGGGGCGCGCVCDEEEELMKSIWVQWAAQTCLVRRYFLLDGREGGGMERVGQDRQRTFLIDYIARRKTR